MAWSEHQAALIVIIKDVVCWHARLSDIWDISAPLQALVKPTDNRKNKFQSKKKQKSEKAEGWKRDEDKASGAGCAGFCLSSFKISRNIS